jgi:hypothetical protein
MSQQMVEQAHSTKEAFFDEYGQCDIIDKIIDIIEKRVRKVDTILAEKN